MSQPLLLNYQFKNLELLNLALCHVSYANEEKLPQDNERLEFLGDSVLQLVMSELLYCHFPQESEGDLSKRRASLVNEKTLAQVALSIQIEQAVKLGKGELKTQGRTKPRILASTLEALIGAIYLDGGLDEAQKFVQSKFTDLLATEPKDLFGQDFKTQLQELAQKDLKITPIYELVLEEGPSHSKSFQICVKAGAEVLGLGDGKTKKIAEQAAAKQAIEKKWGNV